MAPKYGATLRNDPNPALEQLVAPPIRQTNQQRVIETAAAFTAVSCSAYLTSGGITAPAGVATTIDWATEVFDTHTMHDTGVNPSRFTIPTGQPGIYRINARLLLTVAGGTYTEVELRVLVNGNEVANEFSGTITANTALMITHEQYMNPGDYYQIQVLMTGVDPALGISTGIDNTYAVVTKQLV
jgi:hypothetical protein